MARAHSYLVCMCSQFSFHDHLLRATLSWVWWNWSTFAERMLLWVLQHPQHGSSCHVSLPLSNSLMFNVYHLLSIENICKDNFSVWIKRVCVCVCLSLSLYLKFEIRFDVCPCSLANVSYRLSPALRFECEREIYWGKHLKGMQIAWIFANSMNETVQI